MPSGSKIRFIFILLLPALAVISCNREDNDVIPDVYVNFTVRIIDFPFLSSFPSCDTVDTYDPRVYAGRESAGGYEGNGVIIYRDSDYQFYTMDMTCPHDFVVNSKNVRVKADWIYATCPVCQTKYQLLGGLPISGPGKYPLKNYKNSYDRGLLYVWNNY